MNFPNDKSIIKEGEFRNFALKEIVIPSTVNTSFNFFQCFSENNDKTNFLSYWILSFKIELLLLKTQIVKPFNFIF